MKSFLLNFVLTLAAGLGLTLSASAQNVRGGVKGPDGQPIIGAAVIIEGTTLGTSTDVDGEFSLNVPNPKSDMLVVSYLGMKEQRVPVNSRTRIDVILEEDATTLDDVVVIGYGTVKKRDLTGAVASIKSDEITATPTANPIEAMQGRVAGLDISRTDGRAGSESSILLRGNRSLTAGQEPLYIIDGIAGSISNLNPNDIASIDVLKDASSTAIYGSAGANGVIMITTKQADAGKVSVDFDAYYGVNSFATYPDPLTGQAWLDYLEEGYYATNGQHSASQAELLTAWGYNATALAPYISAGKWIDWQDTALQTGTQQNYSLSIRGGNEVVKGNFSLGYNSAKGIWKNDKSDMYTARAGVDVKVTKWLKAGIQTGLTFKDADSRNSRMNYSITRALPLGEAYDENGDIRTYTIDGYESVETVNLIYDDKDGVYRHNSKSIAITANPYVDVTFLPGFTFRSILGTSLSNSRSGTFQAEETYMSLTGSSSPRNATYATSFGYNYTWENILNFQRTFAHDHDLGVTFITSWSKNQHETSSAYNEGFQYDQNLWYGLTGNRPLVSSSYYHKNKMSLAGRVNYSYKGKYLVTASVRYDGVSQLYNHWDTFPAAAVAWRISEEKFMSGAKGWLDNLKLRVGYGVSGNPNVDAYVARTGVTSDGLDKIDLGGGLLSPSVLTQAVGNHQQGWEKSYNLNVGLDFGFFNGRIDGSIEFYDTDTRDVLYNRSLPTTSGGFTPKAAYTMVANVARMQNRGIEITLNTRNIVTKNFQWTTNFTFAYNKEQVKSIDLGSGTTVDNLISLGLFMGHPKSTRYGYKKIGIWQKDEAADAAVFGLKPGDSKIESRLQKQSDGVWTLTDDNGNVTTYTADNQYQINAADQQILGSGSPSSTWGINNTFTFYGFDVNIFMTGRYGYLINADLLGMFKYGQVNMPATYNYWTENNPTNDFPRPYLTRSYDKSSPTDGLSTVDGSYWKIKTITLGYTLPSKVLSKAKISRLRIYATINNPFVFSRSHLLKDMDPETGANDKWPMYKQMVFGVNLSF